MIVELASLPPMVQAFIKTEQQVQVIVKDEQVYFMPLHKVASKPRQAGLLAHLNSQTDDDFWFEPMSKEELAWYNGDNTDNYGIGL